MRALHDAPWTPKMIETALRTDMSVFAVWPDSPAAGLGIRPDWHLFTINGATPTAALCRAARRGGINSMVFFDPDSGTVHVLDGGDWPFGIQLIPHINDELKEAISAGEIDAPLLHKLWSQGNWKDFADLLESFEKSLTPMLSQLFGGAFSGSKDPAKRAQKMAAQDRPFQHLMLALCHLARGDVSACDFFLDARAKAMDRMKIEADLVDNTALELFLDVVVLNSRGRLDEARTRAGQMLQVAPRNKGAIALYCKLMGSDPLRFWPALMEKPFPVAYALPQRDIYGQWPDGGTVKLEDSVVAMAEGQMLLVYALGPYRTNGPMQSEMDTLIGLHKHDPDRIAAVHLITANTNPTASWSKINQVEDMARDAGVPVRVLFDEGDTVAENMAIDEAPSLFVLDHKGRVVSMETLADENGYWQAVSVMKGPGGQQ